MTQQLDPWRILGLAPGASADEIRRAYRRLAKANHPDAAGETAIPRFLAIQAAYEQLVRPSARRRPGTRPGATGAAARPEPWRADPERARASGRADGRRPGARPSGTSGPDRAGGPTGAGSTGAGPAAADGNAGAGGSRSSANGAGGSTRARRPSGRRRSPNKATPYSTSYDPGDEEPFEPGWSGAGWYGAASGTYWTINPKEYADPRKHGPEYQRRARRDAGGWILDDQDGSSPADAPTGGTTEEGFADGPAQPGPEPTWTGSASPSRASAGPSGSYSTPTGKRVRPAPRRRSWVVEPPPDRRFRGPLLRTPSTPRGRFAMALLAWPPLGLAIAAGIGEESGCGRFAASCSEVSSPGTWIVLAAIFLLLLALPRPANWAAHGTLATIFVGVPTAIVLSAGGGAREPATSATVLSVVLVLAWIAGVGYAIVVPRLGGRSARATDQTGREASPPT